MKNTKTNKLISLLLVLAMLLSLFSGVTFGVAPKTAFADDTVVADTYKFEFVDGTYNGVDYKVESITLLGETAEENQEIQSGARLEAGKTLEIVVTHEVSDMLNEQYFVFAEDNTTYDEYGNLVSTTQVQLRIKETEIVEGKATTTYTATTAASSAKVYAIGINGWEVTKNTAVDAENQPIGGYVLSVGGAGVMYNFPGNDDAPWKHTAFSAGEYVANAYQSEVTKIIVGKDLTTVGTNAFLWMKANREVVFEGDKITAIYKNGIHSNYLIEKIELPSSLTYIAGAAFYDCKNLIEVTFKNADNLTYLGGSSFGNCTKLKRFNNPTADSNKNIFPENIEYVGKHIFRNHGGIIGALQYPNAVTYVGDIVDHGINIMCSMDLTNVEDIENYLSKLNTQTVVYINETPADDVVVNSTLFALAVTNGGIYADGTVFNREVLANPSLDGYVFDGWYTSAKYDTESKCVAVALVNSKYPTYYAKFDYDLEFYANNTDDVTTETSIGTKTLSIGMETMLNNPTEIAGSVVGNKGLAFVGWNTKPDGSGTMYIDDTIVLLGDEKALYAQWSDEKVVYDGEYYGTLQEALDIAEVNGGEVTLIANVDENCVIPKNVKLICGIYTADNVTGTNNTSMKIVYKNDMLVQEVWENDAWFELIAYGKAGANLEYRVYPNNNSENYVLEIVGDGLMDNYASVAVVPWSEYADKIETIILPEGLESIGNYAFYNFDLLETDLSFPESLTSIGSYAYYDCDGIKTLTFHDGITNIGVLAFYSLSGVTGDLILPKHMTVINSKTFLGSKFTGKLLFPSDLITIGSEAFNEIAGFNGVLIFPDSMVTLGQGAFRKNGSYDSLVFGKSFKIFSGSIHFLSVTLNDKVMEFRNSYIPIMSNTMKLFHNSPIPQSIILSSDTFDELPDTYYINGGIARIIYKQDTAILENSDGYVYYDSTKTAIANLGGGAFVNHKGFTDASKKIILAKPVKTGYIFDGWYIDNDKTNETVYDEKVEVGTEVVQNADGVYETYYAKWNVINDETDVDINEVRDSKVVEFNSVLNDIDFTSYTATQKEYVESAFETEIAKLSSMESASDILAVDVQSFKDDLLTTYFKSEKETLLAKIDAIAEGLVEADYTAETWEEFIACIAADKEAVNGAADMAALNAVELTANVDILKTALQLAKDTKLAELEGQVDLTTAGTYTVDSWETYVDAYDVDVAFINASEIISEIEGYSFTADASALITLQSVKDEFVASIASLIDKTEYSAAYVQIIDSRIADIQAEINAMTNVVFAENENTAAEYSNEVIEGLSKITDEVVSGSFDTVVDSIADSTGNIGAKETIAEGKNIINEIIGTDGMSAEEEEIISVVIETLQAIANQAKSKVVTDEVDNNCVVEIEYGTTLATLNIPSSNVVVDESMVVISNEISAKAKAEMLAKAKQYTETDFAFTMKISGYQAGDAPVSINTNILAEDGKEYVVAHWTVIGVELLETYIVEGEIWYDTNSFSPFILMEKEIPKSSNLTIALDTHAPVITVDGNVATITDKNLAKITINSEVVDITGDTVEIDLSEYGNGEHKIVAVDKYGRETSETVVVKVEEEKPTPTVAPTTKPEVTEKPTVTPEEQKTNSGMIVWIALGVLAVCGVGFAVLKKKRKIDQ